MSLRSFALLATLAFVAAVLSSDAVARLRRTGSITVTTSINTSDPNFDYVIFEVTNNTGETLKDFHTDPDSSTPKGTPQTPPTGPDVTGSWSAGTGDGAHNWGTSDGGLPDGKTASFKIQIPKGWDKSRRGEGAATNDGDLDPDDGVTARTAVAGVPTTS